MRTLKVFKDAKSFELAADPTRRRIIHLLRARELSVSLIADELKMTPQAIYHHVRKMLDAGLIEVAKEERVDHFIETYYRATAELFEFSYGETSDQKYKEARTKEALQALTRIGLTIPIDEETIAKYAKQDAIEIATYICMNDKQFEELQTLQREARELLKPKVAEPLRAPAK
jgi:DNA-binding transcriptional ArsR family regulator